MDEEKRKLVYRVVRVAIVLWVGLLLTVCGSCDGTEEPDATDTPEPPVIVDNGGTEEPGPTDTPEPDVAVGVDYEVRRERAGVRAHIDGLSASLSEFDLVTLANNNWQEMLDHGCVATNGVGRAELRADCTQVSGAPVCNCEAVILYQGSNLVSRPCHPEESAGTCATGQALLANCDICFETLSSRTCPEGTWVSITYLGQSEITIVTVGEGAATVTPVTVLDYEERGPFDFEFEAREWSDKPITLEAEPVATESGEASLPFFLYIAPEANLKRLMTQAEELGIELPPPGEPLPAEQLRILTDPESGLPPVLEMLEWTQPNLQLWMYELSISAFERGGIQFPPIEAPSEVQQVTLEFDGEQLGDWRVQEAFVLAIDKESVTTQAFSAEWVAFTAIIGGEAVDAYTIPYDPEQALAMLDEAAYDRDRVVIALFPEEDNQVALAATLIAEQLSLFDIPIETMPVPWIDLKSVREELDSGGEQVMTVYDSRPFECATEATGEFAALWQSHRTQLGCPLVATPKVIQDAEQPFENGRMLWRADNRHIYVIYEEGPRAGTYDMFLDEWLEGDPEYSCDAAPPLDVLLQPKRGFGLVWCTLGGPDALIGWALREEEGFDAGTGDPLVQDFGSGVVFRDSVGMDSGMAYVLSSRTNRFEQVSY